MSEKNPTLSDLPFIPSVLAVKADEILEMTVAKELDEKDPEDEIAKAAIEKID